MGSHASRGKTRTSTKPTRVLVPLFLLFICIILVSTVYAATMDLSRNLSGTLLVVCLGIRICLNLSLPSTTRYFLQTIAQQCTSQPQITRQIYTATLANGARLDALLRQGQPHVSSTQIRWGDTLSRERFYDLPEQTRSVLRLACTKSTFEYG